MTVSYPGVHYITVYTALYRLFNSNIEQASEDTRLNSHFGHNFIIVTGLEYFAIFNFCDFHKPAKFRKN